MSNEEAQMKSLDKATLDLMFSGTLATWKMRKTFKKFVMNYFKQIGQAVEEAPNRYLLAHSTLQNTIGNYFVEMGWDVGFEVPSGSLSSSYRFDVMAQKGAKTIVVEVKPEITTRDLGQILGYVFDVSKKFKKSRVFLGTDILNFDVILNGEILDIIVDNARNHNLGAIFADKNQAWLIPAEFFLIK